MRVVIASDIHGSALFCGRLLEAYKKEKAERLILLGDVLYHGPRNDLPEGYAPKEVIAMLNPIREEILCVRGNCDAEVDQMVLEFPIMDSSKKLDFWEKNVYITHGHHLENEPKGAKKGDAVFYGHTHVPAFEEKSGIVYINPGSVSIPKNGSHRGYILFDGSKIEFKDLEMNVIEEKNI
ncbi:MAG: phosphodiesterase [Clostridia bacterium]|nr:phosphodiesterase [Clostridia bacterium]